MPFGHHPGQPEYPQEPPVQPALALQPAEAEVVLVLPFYRILQTLE